MHFNLCFSFIYNNFANIFSAPTKYIKRRQALPEYSGVQLFFEADLFS